MVPTMASTTESTPLLQDQTNQTQAPSTPPRPTASKLPPRPQRSVTFNPTVTASSPPTSSTFRPSSYLQPLPPVTAHHGKPPVLSALNSKLRRRNSTAGVLPAIPAPKIGPQRTTRTAQKLKLLPDPEQGDDGPDEESGRDVYAQFTRIKDPTSRRDAARLGKEDREKLPRVTAYCTASSYRMDDLMRFLKGKARLRGAMPKLFDECIYSPYSYGKSGSESLAEPGQPEHPLLATQERRYSDSAIEVESHNELRRSDVINLHSHSAEDPTLHPGESSATQDVAVETPSPSDVRGHPADFDISVHIPEVFLFDYGTVVLWGMTLHQEQRFLKEIAKFEVEKLAKDDIQTEDFNFYYTRDYQARIYNDFISLREKKNYMTKLAISHALAQSVKTSLYEDLVDNTIETTKDIPSQIATSGKVDLTRRQINMQIGELFILRINIHLQGSVLDAPELMWAEPQLDPVYQAVRSYLEMDQRVSLLTERLNVIADLLAVLKDQLTATHGELLEWIVIVLIAGEILVAAANILVDLYAGVE